MQSYVWSCLNTSLKKLRSKSKEKMARALERPDDDPRKAAEQINKNAHEKPTSAELEFLGALEYSWDSDYFDSQKDLLDLMRQKYQGIQPLTKNKK